MMRATRTVPNFQSRTVPRAARQRSKPEWAETLAALQSYFSRGARSRGLYRAIERDPTDGRGPPSPPAF